MNAWLVILRNIILQKLGATQKPSSGTERSKQKEEIHLIDDEVIFVENEKSSPPPAVTQKPSSTASTASTAQLHEHLDSTSAALPAIPSSNVSTADSSPDKQTAPKRNDWDMFAEQDIDSNFDVSVNVSVT